jgi:hypothetical protein
LGGARFKDLEKFVKSTRTLTKRLNQLQNAGLIERNGKIYRSTKRGFNLLFDLLSLDYDLRLKWVNMPEFRKISYSWLRILLLRLIKFLHEVLKEKLVSVVLYGSTVRGDFVPGKSDVDLLCIVEDEVKEGWRVFKEIRREFKETEEYKLCDNWFVINGFYGCPSLTIMDLPKTYAMRLQPPYLDMIFYRAILYDKQQFFEKLLKKLEKKLVDLGSQRIQRADGTWYWILKPDLKPGEPIVIDLTK